MAKRSIADDCEFDHVIIIYFHLSFLSNAQRAMGERREKSFFSFMEVDSQRKYVFSVVDLCRKEFGRPCLTMYTMYTHPTLIGNIFKF